MSDPEKTARSRKISYEFDAVPKVVSDLVRDEALRGLDTQVLIRLLRFRRSMRNSCWTTRAVLVREVGRSEATVKRCLRRLIAAGLILHVEVPVPDPDEPRNKTGWRFYFPFVHAENGDPDPSRAHARNLGVKTDPDIPSNLTPPSGQLRPPPGVNSDPQCNTETKRLPPEERKNQTTTTNEAESSSGFSPSEGEKDGGKDPDDWQNGYEARWLARRLLGEGHDRKIQDLVEASNEELVVHVLGLYEARVKNKKSTPVASPFGWIHGAWEKAKGEWTPPKSSAPGADGTPTPIAQETPDQRRNRATELILSARAVGIDFHWVEENRHFIPIRTRGDSASLASFDSHTQSYKAEIRAILEAEKSRPDWVNPMPIMTRPTPMTSTAKPVRVKDPDPTQSVQPVATNQPAVKPCGPDAPDLTNDPMLRRMMEKNPVAMKTIGAAIPQSRACTCRSGPEIRVKGREAGEQLR